MKTGIITEIKRATFHDGPGCRTIVFMKGCPLSCKWCHNPEAINPKPEILLYPEKCIGCNMCDKGCFSGARVICGKEITAKELISEILLDLPYYESGGGVTFSGGEPLYQKDFLLDSIKECKKNGISVAIETSMIYFDEEIFSLTDYVLADFKVWNTHIHKKFVGVGNELIKENFTRLDKLGVKIFARTPIIPEIEQGVDKISEFLSTLKNVKKYELLPYHPLGLPKYSALGLKIPEFTVPSDELMKELNRYAFDLC